MYHGRHARHRSLKKLLRIALVVLIIACVLYPFYEPYRLRVSTLEYETSDLSRDVGQLRIVFLSDLHESRFPFFTQSQTDALIARVNALHADIIILGGDYTDSEEGATEFFQRIRYGKHFQSVYGCFGVLGENDRKLDDAGTSELRAAMIAAGVTPLINDSAQIRIGSNTISVVGIDDVLSGWPDPDTAAQKVHSTDFTILACHNPQIISSLSQSMNADGKRNWYDLVLFGHTHGGQAPLFGSILHLTNGIRSEYISGVHLENRIPVLTSNGVGTTGVPVRLFHPPEIHLITIKAAK